MYRYVCDKTNVTYEINTRLESTAFGTGSTDDNKAAKDGETTFFFMRLEPS